MILIVLGITVSKN